MWVVMRIITLNPQYFSMECQNMNIAVAQSGGPTCAINSSLAGVIKEALKSEKIDKIYGCLYGIEGVLNDNLVILNDLFVSEDTFALLKQTPATALGSCRHKLPHLEDSPETFEKITEKFEKLDIGAFFYIGGNDSMNTVNKLSKYFKTVRFVSVSGNHSRIDKKDNALKDERLDDLVEWYCKARLNNIDNILFDTSDKIDTSMYVVNVRGLNYVGSHGDYDVGKGKILDLQAMIRKPIYAVLYGHMHHNCIDTYQGIKMIMAGSMQGVDNYCITKRIFGRPEQLVSIVNDTGIVCNYDIGLE